MGLIKSLSIGIGVNSKGLGKGLNRASKQVQSWASGVMSIATGGVIANVATGVIDRGLSTITSSVESAFSFAIRDEQLETAFGTLLGGADKAKAVLGDLRDFGASTPFEFPGLADAAKKLISFGFSQEQLLPEMQKLGDVAAGLDIPFSDLADIYGKARVAGKVMSEDINQLAGRGIPIFDELAKVMGVPAGEIKDLASKGKIGFAELQKSFDGMTGQGGRFAGMMAAQSQTAGGLISTLRDNWNLMLGSIGAKLFETFDIKGLINQAIGAVQSFTPTLDWLLEQAVMLGPVFKAGFMAIGASLNFLWQIASSVIGAIAGLFGDFGSVTMDGFVRGAVTAFASIEFALLNWQDVWQLAIKTVAFRLVEFGNDVTHLFTKQIPAALVWASKNHLGILMRMASNKLRVYKNLSENIVAIAANLPALISGSMSLDEIFKPLNRGMVDVVTNALELPERAEGGVERLMRQELESLENKIGEGLAGHVSQRLRELIPPDIADGVGKKPLKIEPPKLELDTTAISMPDIETPNVEDVTANNATSSEAQFAGLAEAGSQEYRDALLRFQGAGGGGRDAIQKEQRDLQKQQLAEQVKANRLAEQAPAPTVVTIGG